MSLVQDIFRLVVFSIYATIEWFYHLCVPQSPKSLENEVALVTGAGHGIGNQLALQLSKLGAKVVCWDINDKTAEKTAQQINRNGGTAWAFKCDVSNREGVAAVAEQTRAIVGNVTMLFNNAGIMPCKPFMSHTPEDVERVFRVNVFAQFWTLFEFWPDFLAQQKGHIVAMSSTAGVTGTPNLTAYCSSKFAIKGLMDALYLEHREMYPQSQIQMTTIHPFTVNTGLAKRPTTRFANLIPISEPEAAAKTIIEAVQRNELNVFVPTHLSYLFAASSLLPVKVKLALYDFLGCGVKPHED